MQFMHFVYDVRLAHLTLKRWSGRRVSVTNIHAEFRKFCMYIVCRCIAKIELHLLYFM